MKGLCWSMPVLLIAEFQLLLVAGCWHFCWQLGLLTSTQGTHPDGAHFKLFASRFDRGSKVSKENRISQL